MAQIPVDKNLMSPIGDIDFAVTIGAISGWTAGRRFGINNAVGTGGAEDIWIPGTPRVLPTVAAVAAVSSSSAEDDENEATPPGTGAWKVKIFGLDANYLEVEETVTLTGTTPVNTSASFIRINRAFVTEVGTNGTNVGNISISVGGDLQAYIGAGDGQTTQTMLTVPASKTLLIESYGFTVGRTSGSADTRMYIQRRLYDENSTNNYQSWRNLTDLYLFQTVYRSGKAFLRCPEKSDVRVQIVSSAATQASAIFEYLVTTDKIIAQPEDV